MDDERIIDLYWARDERALEETERKYGGYCHTIARNILSDGEDARECVNDTWLGAWNAMPEDRPRRLAVYLGTITRRVALNRWKAAHTAKRGGGETALAVEELSECIPGGRSAEACLEAAELGRTVEGFVRALPDVERQVFLCRYWYLDPVADIARRFGFSQSKVKSMLARTRQRLWAYLRKEGLVS